jgi:hypothetical protein
MIRAPSVQKQYGAVFSGDPAFVQLPEDATDEQKAAHEQKWKVARETGDYSALRIEGAGDPTVFTMKPLSTDAFAALYALGAAEGAAAANMMAFRVSLQSVDNFGKVDIKRIQHKKFGPIATTEFFDKAGLPAGLSVKIALEIGDIVLSKAWELSPK